MVTVLSSNTISPHRGKFQLTQIYKGSSHKGTDSVGIDDKGIYATANGIAEAVRHDTHHTGGLGLYVRIKQDGTNWRYYFGHLSRAFIKPGQRVKIGDKIGEEGNTGHSFGSHLHYEVRKTTDSSTFMNVSEIAGIPNRLGVYEVATDETIKDVDVTIGNTVVKSKLINGITYSPLRETIEAVKSELDVVWDKNKGAGIEF